MPMTAEQFLRQLTAVNLFSEEELTSFLAAWRKSADADGEQVARELIKQKKLTAYQAQAIYQGKGKSLQLGNYVILDKLGQGGMGTVLKARHKRMGRTVALKVMSTSAMKSPDAVKRFQREVQAAAKLEHRNIVAAYDADEANNTHFLVMQFIEGNDLSVLVKSGGILPVAKAVDYILQAATGLEYAHQQGVVHRDIKPANLLVDAQGTVKVLDMGLARIEGESQANTELTHTGTVMGTVDYMAPEQALSTKHADARSDIYSLGISLWYLLTGRSAYEGESMMAKLLAHRDAPIPSLRAARSEVPASLEAVFRKMVAKTPHDRFQSMTEVIRQLQRHQAGSSTDREAPLPEAPIREAGFTDFLNQLAAEQDGSKAHTRVRTSTATNSDPEAATMATADVMQSTDPEAKIDRREIRSAKSSIPHSEEKRSRSLRLDRRVLWGGGGVAAVLVLLVLIAFTERRVVGQNDLLHQDPSTMEPAATPQKTMVTSTAPIQESQNLPIREQSEFDAGIRLTDREATEWVLARDGFVEIGEPGQPMAPYSRDHLPAEPFEVRGIYLKDHLDVNAQTLSMFKDLKMLQTVKLTATPRVSGHLSVLNEMTALRHFEAHNFPLSEADGQVIASLDKLMWLLLEGTNLSENVLQNISRLPRLEYLSITGMPVTQRMVESISHSPHLSSLTLRNCKTDDSHVAQLAQMDRLMLLQLSGCPVSGDNFSAFIGRRLRVLLVTDCTELSVPGFKQIAGLKQLTILNAEGASITDEALMQIPSDSQLMEILLTKTQVTDQGIQFLRTKLPGLTVITNNGVWEPGATSLRSSDQYQPLFWKILTKMIADGSWTSVSEEVDGRPTSAKVVSERARTILFKDDHCRMELTENGRRLVYDGTYQFIPPYFEFRFDGIGPDGKPAHFRGIVNARYDLLQLCFRHSADTSLPLPPKFKTEPNTGYVFELLTFKRHY